MPDDRQNNRAYKRAFSRQLKDLEWFVASGLNGVFPLEVAIEMQHMAVHLASASRMALCDYASKNHELANALGHLDRAYQDGCKVLVHDKFSSLRNDLAFMRGWNSARRAEGKKHDRDMAAFLQGNAGALPMEWRNHICQRFKDLLIRQRLITEAVGVVAETPWASENNPWGELVPEMETWVDLDLFFNSLKGQKHHEALQIFLFCLISLDKERLRRLNLQLMLDTLLAAGPHAATLGWKNCAALQPHAAFIRGYVLNQPWTERYVMAEEAWIRPLFDDLRNFYKDD